MNRFKGALQAMYSARGQDVLFLETSLHHHKRRHCRVEVIPMDAELARDAPLYFQKEINEAGEEWSTHRSSLIDTAGKGLRRCIPRGFPYFHVSWLGGGYVHVIEDEDAFPVNFGVDICAGMMGLPPGRWDRKGAKRRSFEEEKRAVLDFVAMWDPFDWTQQLEGGEQHGSGATAPTAAGAASATGGAGTGGKR